MIFKNGITDATAIFLSVRLNDRDEGVRSAWWNERLCYKLIGESNGVTMRCRGGYLLGYSLGSGLPLE